MKGIRRGPQGHVGCGGPALDATERPPGPAFAAGPPGPKRSPVVCWTLELPASPSAAPLARRFSRRALRGCPDAVIDVAQLLVTELVTNAVVHTGSAPIIRVDVDPGGVRVAVHDNSRTIPRVQRPSDETDGGRGLFLVEALATSWGSSETENGKLIWFAL
jgi:anti-sigma regulatory factor (Ser/Thr protein kinase)